MIKKKLKEVNSGINIEILENGYTLEVSGRDKNENYKIIRMFCANITDLTEQIEAAQSLYDN
jgi:hypothetical protein